MIDDSKALPAVCAAPHLWYARIRCSTCAIEREMREGDLPAFIASMDPEQLARVIGPYLPEGADVAHRLLELTERVVGRDAEAVADARAKVAAYESFWREHGEVVTHCPGHHAQLVRDADGLLGHSPKPTEVSEELDRVRATLAKVEADRDEWKESASMACETPADDCTCAGCRYADEKMLKGTKET
jgi:hypothetical protein